MSAVNIGNPFPVVFAVVKVKHGSHRVHTNPVRMVLLHPVQRIGNQVIGNLGPAIIVNQRSPVRVRPLPRVRMLVKAGAVKLRKAVGISGKMGRNPV